MDLMDYSQETFDAIEAEYSLRTGSVRDHHRDPGPALKATTWSSVHRTPSGTRAHAARFLETVETRALKTGTRSGSRSSGSPTEPHSGGSRGQSRRARPLVRGPRPALGRDRDRQDIVLFDENLDHAEAGQAVTITLDREVDASRGVIVSGDSPCEVSDQFEVNLVWMDQTPDTSAGAICSRWGRHGQRPGLGHQAPARHQQLRKTRVKAQLNDLSVVTLKTDRPVPYEGFSDSSSMGRSS